MYCYYNLGNLGFSLQLTGTNLFILHILFSRVFYNYVQMRNFKVFSYKNPIFSFQLTIRSHIWAFQFPVT